MVLYSHWVLRYSTVYEYLQQIVESQSTLPAASSQQRESKRYSSKVKYFCVRVFPQCSVQCAAYNLQFKPLIRVSRSVNTMRRGEEEKMRKDSQYSILQYSRTLYRIYRYSKYNQLSARKFFGQWCVLQMCFISQ